jgi:putative protease
VTASTELDADGLRQLTRGEPDILVPAAGRQTLMLLSHCPARVQKGLDRNRRDCRMCDADNPDSVRGTSLRDRKGAEYPLIRERLPEGCEIRMLQMEPVNILRQVRALGMNWSAEVTVETDLPHLLAEPSSEGHWKRAVE